jgi:hypothetical protein
LTAALFHLETVQESGFFIAKSAKSRAFGQGQTQTRQLARISTVDFR